MHLIFCTANILPEDMDVKAQGQHFINIGPGNVKIMFTAIILIIMYYPDGIDAIIRVVCVWYTECVTCASNTKRNSQSIFITYNHMLFSNQKKWLFFHFNRDTFISHLLMNWIDFRCSLRHWCVAVVMNVTERIGNESFELHQCLPYNYLYLVKHIHILIIINL